MNLPQGAFAYPASIDAAAVRAFAASLRTTAERLDSVDDTVDRAAASARQTWQGTAAETFSYHMNDRGHAFELASERVRDATHALDGLADAVDRSQRAYVSAVEAERRAVDRGSAQERDEAVWAETEAVGIAVAASFGCDQTLTALAELLAAYATRSFLPVGQHLDDVLVDNGLAGRDLMVDALRATNEMERIAPDEIQVRRLDDGSYMVVLPGVTDLTDNVTTPWNWLTGGPQDTVRKVANAQPSVINGGPNPYAEAVKMAMQRAGIPAGSDVTFVGHSYGSYTAVDLAGDDAFNSIDGTSSGYNVRVRNVMGFGADVDWKLKDVPAQTNVVALNSRDDVVYRAETSLHPETREVLRQALRPGADFIPSPWYSPATRTPSGRPNQVEVEINGGRQWDKGDGYYSGHDPRNYARSVPNVGDQATALYDALGSHRVVETYNVRVPDGPRDTVPPTQP